MTPHLYVADGLVVLSVLLVQHAQRDLRAHLQPTRFTVSMCPGLVKGWATVQCGYLDVILPSRAAVRVAARPSS